jgi:hypothetical protein
MFNVLDFIIRVIGVAIIIGGTPILYQLIKDVLKEDTHG